MTQPWTPETGISREKYNKWVEGLHDQNYRGSLAHPSVTLPPSLADIRGTPNLPFPMPSQAPRPEGFERAVTGLADYITGNKWDFDQRGRGGSNRWEEQIGRGTGGGDPREAMRQWNAPNDLTVSQGAEQGVRRGGGILNRIGDFLGGLGGGVVPGSPEAPADMQGTQMVRDPQTGEWVHPNVLKHWSRQ
jgi:hypothetical protein